MYRILRCSSSSASLNHFLQHSTKQPIIHNSIHTNIHTNTNININTLASQIPKNNIQSTKSTKQPILAQSIHRTLVSKTQTTSNAAAAAAINNDDLQITGVSDDVASIIKLYALKPQTSASLMTLMKTGRGEYLHKTYDGHEVEDDACSKVATDKILMQVSVCVFFSLSIFNILEYMYMYVCIRIRILIVRAIYLNSSYCIISHHQNKMK